MRFILKEGLIIIKLLIIISTFFYILGKYFDIRYFIYISFIIFLMLLFSIFFFRNPKRIINPDPEEICSPADGMILEITKEFNEYFNNDVHVIRIFLSIFNVHSQRSPIEGEIDYLEYRKGKFLPAMVDKAHIANEKNIIGIIDKKNNRKVMFSQIAGLIARRIVFYKEKGDKVKKGELVGLIKFGSQVDIYLPIDCKLLVKKGDKVKGGISVLAKFKDK